MFRELFQKPSVIHRHEHAPYREERERYLRHCKDQGYTFLTLVFFARELLWIAKKLHINPQGTTLRQVRSAAHGWAERESCCGQSLNIRWTRARFIQVARSWLRFLGYWVEPRPLSPFEHLVDSYKLWMEKDRGFTPATIDRGCSLIRQFLLWYGNRSCSLSTMALEDIETFLSDYGSRGACRKSVKNMATTIRTFLRYAGSEGWCSSSIAGMVHGPRIFAQEQLPQGPSWEDVQRLIASMETQRPADVRDRAIIMLLAVYGFRATEVATLTLDDIDWEKSLISVPRVKRRGRQIYPLALAVGNAIIRYVREVRPPSSFRELFLRLVHPFRPLSRGGLYRVTAERMRVLGIKAPHIGPHSLRHACATHLAAEGLSLKEIGDHLGHRSFLSTRIYAKVDLPGLREVAAFGYCQKFHEKQ